jgi:hypothetical protein
MGMATTPLDTTKTVDMTGVDTDNRPGGPTLAPDAEAVAALIAAAYPTARVPSHRRVKRHRRDVPPETQERRRQWRAVRTMVEAEIAARVAYNRGRPAHERLATKPSKVRADARRGRWLTNPKDALVA